jgi:ribosomal protein S18 acetylase RimI-like enzyme
LPNAELLVIAVSDQVRNRGVGGLLGAEMLRRLRDRGADGVKVIVDADNAIANRLYERIGFERTSSISIHDGRASNVWVHQ